MIVNYTASGWEVITQRAHGLLAAQIAMHWAKSKRPARWTETVLAIAEHDDAQIELEADDLLTPQGGPVNFAMKLFEPEHCRRLADFSLSKSRYIALLTSMHMVFLYQKEEETNPLVKPFLAEQRRLQKEWCTALHIDAAEAKRIYALLEWCDAFSLLLCRHEVQPEHRTIEISEGPDKKQYRLQQLPSGALTVHPWPFEDDRFELYLETRLIEQLTFKSNEEFKQCFLNAQVTEKHWLFTKK
ncbi:hypothetical protein GCM10027037_31900 [Mucilaginibacter koreensis]